MVNVVVIFISFLFWELHISWVVLMTANPSTSLSKFGISEWLAGFRCVYRFMYLFDYFLVSLDEVAETVTQKIYKLH